VVGFRFPKLLKRAIQIGVALALIACKVESSRAGVAGEALAEA
jgi:hypothetical protein